MKRPIAYLRKSRVTSDRHVSWEVQEAEVRALAARHGDVDVEIMSDWNRSGRKTRSRPEYLKLRAMVAAGEVSAVYSYSLSRLGRSLSDLSSLIEECVAQGTAVRLVVDAVDTSTASGRLLTNVLSSVAQFEAEVAQERAKDTITVRRARGDHVGSAGYGKRLVAGRLEDHPGERVDDVVQAYRDAGGFSGAAKLLNARGVPTKVAGHAWDGVTVARIIRREARGEVAGKRIEPRVRQRGSFTLSRLLICPCGQVMTGRTTSHTTKYGSYGPYTSYQCYRGRYDAAHPRPYMVSESSIIDVVKERAEAQRAKLEGTYQDAVDQSERLALEDRRRRVIENYEDGLIDKVERDGKLVAIDDRLNLVDAKAAVITVPPAIDWERWDATALNAVLRSFWTRIELGPDLAPARFVPALPAEYAA